MNYRRYAKTLKRSLRQIYRADKRLFVDFAGSTLALADGYRAEKLKKNISVGWVLR